MKIGLLSDTHGRHLRTAAAVHILEDLGAAALIHCGDVGGERVLDALTSLPAWFVWGNTDHADASLERYAREIGLHPPVNVPQRIVFDNRRLDVYHGHEPQFERLVRLVDAGEHDRLAAALRGIDYVLYGHTHAVMDLRMGQARFINPGALHRACPFTVGLLDLATDELSFWEVDEARPADAPPRRYRPA